MNQLNNKVEINMNDLQVIEIEQGKFELFKPIEGHDGKYMISTLGTVISLCYGKIKIRKPRKDKDSYLQITLVDKSRKSGIRTYQVHRLVAQTFLPDFNPDLEIDHIDGIRWNNDINNLQQINHRDNIKKRTKNRKKYTRLNETQKELIKMLYIPKDEVFGFRNMCKHFDVSPETLKKILYN